MLVGFTLVSNAQISEADVKTFITAYASKSEMSESEVGQILSSATYQPSIIKKMDRPAEKKLLWNQYRKIFITPERIAAGIEFMEKHHSTLVDVSQETGIPSEIIAAIIGVETYYGKIMGTYKVLDALYTLSFAYPRRAKYFRSELEAFLKLSQKEQLNVSNLKGSYAGAIGYCQFMPSSYEAYAVSYDDGTRDLVNSPEDAIASVANYLKVHRWRTDDPIASQAKVNQGASPHSKSSPRVSNSLAYFNGKGYSSMHPWDPDTKVALMRFEKEDSDEYWFGAQNFYVITRYNHSPFYALAVFQLAQEIKVATP